MKSQFNIERIRELLDKHPQYDEVHGAICPNCYEEATQKEADRLIESGSGYELVWKRFACYNEQCMDDVQRLNGDRTEIARTKAVKRDDNVGL